VSNPLIIEKSISNYDQGISPGFHLWAKVVRPFPAPQLKENESVYSINKTCWYRLNVSYSTEHSSNNRA
jgi:hypothetical protein